MYMDIKTAFESFRELELKLHALNHASGVIYLDATTVAPKNTSQGRGITLGILSSMEYDLMNSEETKSLIAYLKEHKNELSDRERRELEVYCESDDYISKIPKEEYSEYVVLVNDAQDVWHNAKENNDFASFAPYLKKIFETQKKFALYYKPDQAPYDTMLDMYEKGLNTEQADEFFAKLRSRIVPLLEKIGQKPQIDISFLKGHFPIEKQREFTEFVMDVMCIDKGHCCCGETEHPYTTNFNKNDVRITTHYHEDDLLSSLFSVVHEGGHALYELGSGDEYEYTVLSGGVSMGIHESQSRLYENIIGRSREFCKIILPKLKELFPSELGNISDEQFYRAVNRSEPSLIRTEADELSYALHVMVRYEIEKGIIVGEIDIDDLPRVWNEKYKEYLGVDVPDDTHGVLQDSHWSGGSVGYFPSYALGSAYGAQIIAKMREDIDIEASLAKGNTREINNWLEEHIFRHGCRYTPDVLLEMVCGSKFDPSYFIDYLEKKYGELYGV